MDNFLCHARIARFVTQYKNIKVTADAFEELKRRKDDGQSWSHFLKELNEKAYAWEERGSTVL